jgi:hypothetical protein
MEAPHQGITMELIDLLMYPAMGNHLLLQGIRKWKFQPHPSSVILRMPLDASLVISEFLIPPVNFL